MLFIHWNLTVLNHSERLKKFDNYLLQEVILTGKDVKRLLERFKVNIFVHASERKPFLQIVKYNNFKHDFDVIAYEVH